MVASFHPGSPMVDGKASLSDAPGPGRASSTALFARDAAAGVAHADEQAMRRALARPAQTLPGGFLLRSLGLQSYLPTWNYMFRAASMRAES